MIKRIALLVIIFTLSLTAPALAAEPDSGTIKGQLVNETENGSSVANQEITLDIYLNDTQADSAITKTDAEGYFVFDDLSTESSYSYQATLNYQEADYASDWLSFDGGETNESVEIVVYDSTTSDEAIMVAVSHTVIYTHTEPDNLLVEEYFMFVNDSDRTYIGSGEPTADGKRETLRFSLPKGATAFQPGYGLMECCILGSEDGFVDTMPVLPGGQEVVYSYMLNYDSEAYTLSRNVNYPTESFDLLVQGEEIKIVSDHLTTEEGMNIEGTWFNRLSGKNLTRGNVLVTQLANLPATKSQGGTIKWIILTLVVLAGGFLVYFLRKKRVQPVPVEDSPDQKQQNLLLEIAQLDNDFENGKIPEEVYRRRRTTKKAQLTELMRRPGQEADKS